MIFHTSMQHHTKFTTAIIICFTGNTILFNVNIKKNRKTDRQINNPFSHQPRHCAWDNIRKWTHQKSIGFWNLCVLCNYRTTSFTSLLDKLFLCFYWQIFSVFIIANVIIYPLQETIPIDWHNLLWS